MESSFLFRYVDVFANEDICANAHRTHTTMKLA
jgi:hypothetical protein